MTNTGPSVVNGDVGVSPGNALVGFPPGIVTPPGTIHLADAVALQAQSDATTAYNSLAGEACSQNLSGQDLGGMTLTTGVYCFDTSAQLTGALTLDAGGSADAVFIFQIGSTLTTASASSVLITNGGVDCNVWWQVGSSATLGTTTSFTGNIIALASVTLTTGANVVGRAFALTGAVTMDTNTIGSPACIQVLPTHTTSPITAVPTDAPTSVSTAVPTTDSVPGATALPTFTPSLPQTSGGSSQGFVGLPNTGGGPPQSTYWQGR